MVLVVPGQGRAVGELRYMACPELLGSGGGRRGRIEIADSERNEPASRGPWNRAK